MSIDVILLPLLSILNIFYTQCGVIHIVRMHKNRQNQNPPPPLYVIERIWLDPPLRIHTFYIFTPLLINFYSDSSFHHSKFLGFFLFYFLRLSRNVTKPAYSLRTVYTFLYTVVNSNVIASVVQKKKSFEILWFKKIISLRTYATLNPSFPL